MLGMKQSFDIWMQQIPGVENTTTDALSRFKNDAFQYLIPDADSEMIPPAIIEYMQSLQWVTSC